MFTRIRYAAQVLSSCPAPGHDRPDIVFEEVKPIEASRASRMIGNFIEIFIVSLLVGSIAAPLLFRLWPTQNFADVNRLTAVVAAMVAILLSQLFEHFKAQVGRHLRIGERVAPYFGHKITDAIKTLRS
jgi:hypothetical protein